VANVKFGLRLLETLTSALYDNPIVLFREYVQNSVDAYDRARKNGLEKIKNFKVDITINENEQTITVFDNGYGISEQDFESEMKDIGVDKKSDLPSQIGFLGIGRLSAIPFCNKLIFRNKPQGSKNIFVFIWDGEKFNEMLINDSRAELEEAFKTITSMTIENYNGQKEEHFFSVTIMKFNEEINLLINQRDFKQQLCSLLPLKYHPKFSCQNEIKKNYQEILNDDLDNTAHNITLNSKPLFKQYTNVNILDAGIWYWPLKFPKTPGGTEEPFGLLWFSFNKKISVNPDKQLQGILVRSKNMLMGNNSSLADAIFRYKTDDYITTYRELTQTLRSVFGEMLINTTRFNDNARRDWFKLDSYYIMLHDIIFEFLKHLHKYRTTASDVFNEKNEANREKNKQKLREAFVNLTSSPNPANFISKFFKAKAVADREKEEKEKEKNEQNDDNKLKYADDDIPSFPFQLKKLYDRILILLREYFSNNKNLKEFLKIRNFIKNGIKEE
jgi:molecular chaperone HtpG